MIAAHQDDDDDQDNDDDNYDDNDMIVLLLWSHHFSIVFCYITHNLKLKNKQVCILSQAIIRIH